MKLPTWQDSIIHLWYTDFTTALMHWCCFDNVDIWHHKWQQLERNPVCGKNSNAITLFPVLTSSSLAPPVMSHIHNGEQKWMCHSLFWLAVSHSLSGSEWFVCKHLLTISQMVVKLKIIPLATRVKLCHYLHTYFILWRQMFSIFVFH